MSFLYLDFTALIFFTIFKPITRLRKKCANLDYFGKEVGFKKTTFLRPKLKVSSQFLVKKKVQNFDIHVICSKNVWGMEEGVCDVALDLISEM